MGIITEHNKAFHLLELLVKTTPTFLRKGKPQSQRLQMESMWTHSFHIFSFLLLHVCLSLSLCRERFFYFCLTFYVFDCVRVPYWGWAPKLVTRVSLYFCLFNSSSYICQPCLSSLECCWWSCSACNIVSMATPTHWRDYWLTPWLTHVARSCQIRVPSKVHTLAHSRV